ncbi:hypothetical protein M3A49_41050 [Paraburkholderia sp. CNPSo 3076]|uniref:hypothetical protein n=1 Tax=Paraburkholderia sp. CNPSo 3076 TaxID=2940936 RepID=UPI0022523C60|nr:hypothetical protein [Paraburkholderia sp. CNPSo 3076]MCX5545728.1 hypothetical protein [Paraburkholderia sp. CNPSo 3076]
MPVDFERIPPQVRVPEASRPSILVWALLLCLMLAAGASLTVFLWRAGKPTNTVWFWFRAVALPVLIWGLLLACRLAWTYVRVNAALATNRTADDIEEQRHELSSQPLAVLGHAWRFSSSEEENSVEDLFDGKIKLRPASSQVRPNTDVMARWLEIPGKRFYGGNARTEHARQTEACEWLLNELMSDLAPQILQLPRQVSMSVDLCVDTVLQPATWVARLQPLLKEKFPSLRVQVKPATRELSLFHADSWHDGVRPDVVRLLVAVQLRKAASDVLANGVAEAASMLLVGTPAVAGQMNGKPALRIHRPARGTPEKVADVLKLAVRWGRTSFDKTGTTWGTGLGKDALRTIRSSCRFGHRMRPVDVDETVGNAGAARAWLATTLAAANAALMNEPQLVIAQEGDDLVALVCQKQT